MIFTKVILMHFMNKKGIVPIISYRLQTDSSIDTMPVCIEIMLRTCQRRLLILRRLVIHSFRRLRQRLRLRPYDLE